MLIDSSLGIGRLRGGDYTYQGIPLIPTYHPSGVLRNPEYRSAVWEDLRRVKALLASRGR
jgi:DNA polymerase